MALTWGNVLAWRLGRQLLDPVGTGSVVDVVERLGAVPAWPDQALEVGIGVRRTGGRTGDATRALGQGEVVKVFAFRGAVHLMTPQDAGAYLVVRASNRQWELTSWRAYYRLEPDDWPRFRAYVRNALDDGPLTRSELAAALGRSSRYRHLREIVAGGNVTLLKPLSWQGDVGFGLPRDGEETYVRLDRTPGWGGLPDLEEAGPRVLTAYLRTYGPAVPERVHDYFSKSLAAPARAVTRWLADVESRVAHVDVEGERLLVHPDDLDDLHATRPAASVRLVPGRDPWVMAPGTTDPHVVPPAHREAISRTANPVLHRGVVAGTWAVRRDRLEVDWWPDSGRVPRTALAEEGARLARFLERDLDVVVAGA
jgi:hypothetical protein